MNLSLFDWPPPKSRLAKRIADLAVDGVYIGTSSWKYPGWLNQIYTPSLYQTRGEFSNKKFEDTCLSEYAATFPTVCGDFAFYQCPSPEFWRKLFDQVPGDFQFSFKCPELFTCPIWPRHPRYGARAGKTNETFMDAEAFSHLFMEPLAQYRTRTAVCIFEFGTMSKTVFPTATDFLAVLDPFLGALPKKRRYAVEVRNPEYLCPAYFRILKSHGVAHVFNAWTRMPNLPTQMAIQDAHTAGFIVVRALLKRGRTYEQAVKAFEPYEKIQDPNEETRDALRELIKRALEERRTAYVYVNNRLEGNAPQTIEAIVEEL